MRLRMGDRVAMNEAEQRAKEYVEKAQTIQLATVGSDGPWVVTVYFWADGLDAVYWVSTPDKVHSQHIAKNPKAAAYVLVDDSQASKRGVSLAGEAAMVTEPDEIKRAITAFATKYGSPESFVNSVIDGSYVGKLYRMKINRVKLFDQTLDADMPEIAVR